MVYCISVIVCLCSLFTFKNKDGIAIAITYISAPLHALSLFEKNPLFMCSYKKIFTTFEIILFVTTDYDCKMLLDVIVSK